MRPTRILLSSRALRHNLAVARDHAGGARIMAVVKADGYGHGLEWVAGVLEEAGSEAFGVASIEEGVRLRDAGIRVPIFIFQGFFREDELRAAEALDLGLVLHRADQVRAVVRRPADAFPLSCFLKVDSGMHRLGVAPEAAPALARELAAAPQVRWYGLFSHMARADTPDDPYNGQQVAALNDVRDGLPAGTGRSLANSAALLALPGARMEWVRPGLMLYGASPFPEREGEAVGLQPVLRLESELIAVQTLAPGDWLGYGAAFQADRHTRVGVVPVGYGDGYPRHLGTGTPIRVNGVATRTLGRVCMDMLFVDLEPVPEAAEGAPVELMGPGVPAERLAGWAGTIPYEILCGLRSRIHRVTE
ncbi:MAG TPA: alanine racemase [Gammaproteobacteria bacterium]|nr:alanine racemase [Gammaproteobacteria bacterium]